MRGEICHWEKKGGKFVVGIKGEGKFVTGIKGRRNLLQG